MPPKGKQKEPAFRQVLLKPLPAPAPETEPAPAPVARERLKEKKTEDPEALPVPHKIKIVEPNIKNINYDDPLYGEMVKQYKTRDKKKTIKNIETILNNDKDTLNDIQLSTIKNKVNDLYLSGKINKDELEKMNLAILAKSNRVLDTSLNNINILYRKIPEPRNIKRIILKG